jgi:acetyltransferase
MRPGDVWIRELESRDRVVLAYVFRHLGEASRYQRYLSIKPELHPSELDRLTTVDHWHSDALIAWSPIPRAPIGIARYVRTDEFDVAEIAVEVVDDWQRRRVGEALMLALRERAMRAGVRRFRASLLSSNRGALALARRLGPCTVTDGRHEVMEIEGRWA